jgi:hypothetical protein
MKIIEKTKLQESSFMVGERTLSDVYWLIMESTKASSIVKPALKGVNLFTALKNLNILALRIRYSGNKPEQMYAGSEAYKLKPDTTSFVQKYKSLGCFLYQCAEEDVEKSSLFQALVKVENLPVRDLIEHTKEYARGYWGN